MIHIDGPYFKDESRRVLMLRGVNLGGSSKVPFKPDGATHRLEGFFDHRNVSFVGRPFPLAEADEHFRRLRAWGLTFLRFLVTWEAVEHAGPGIYDEAYLDYLRRVVQKAGEYGIQLFIDPHQDVWSRFSGGCGAPGWTLEAAGFDIRHFKETGAAVVHAVYGDPYPWIWPTNGTKLAAATMFSLFFGGNDFAPQTKVDGEPVQEYLQGHYIRAIQQIAARLNDLPNVAGYDTLNEPLPGYIGWSDLRLQGKGMLMGACPTPFQAMLLGVGIPQEVGYWEIGLTGMRKTGKRLLNAEKVSAWREGQCIWQRHGVWDLDSAGNPVLLEPAYFNQVSGRQVNFTQDYYLPFAVRFANAIREVDPRAIIFLETEAGHWPPDWQATGVPSVAFVPHWYDPFIMIYKRSTPHLAVNFFTHTPVVGAVAVRKSFASQMASLKEGARQRLDGAPTLIGEFGIPFDLENKKSFHSGNYSGQTGALDRQFKAVEANLLSSTLWNYTPDNTHTHGDQWNNEDYSIFSRDLQSDPADINSGGRALEAVARPYPRATAGEPGRLSFDLKHRRFKYTFRHDPDVAVPTEIFVPSLQYPQGYRVEISDGTYEILSEEQTLRYHHDLGTPVHTIVIRP